VIYIVLNDHKKVINIKINDWYIKQINMSWYNIIILVLYYYVLLLTVPSSVASAKVIIIIICNQGKV